MTIIEIIKKSAKEQFRSFWLLLLTFLLAPFFVFIFYLIGESEAQSFDLIVINPEKELTGNAGQDLINQFYKSEIQGIEETFILKELNDKEDGVKQLMQGRADMVLVLPEDFTRSLTEAGEGNKAIPEIEFLGDLTDYGYLIASIYSFEIIEGFFREKLVLQESFHLIETPVGKSASLDEFSYYVPGLLILSVIMLLFISSIAFVSEVENKTIIRIRLAGVRAWEFVAGITAIQVVIGVIAVFITLGAAYTLGFRLEENWGFLALIAILASVSVIGFSLIVAALTRTTNDILVVGNFPMFLFMFFTGAVFPISSAKLFTFMDYDFQLHALMSPAHAISALHKVLVLENPVREVLPEIISLAGLTIAYFSLGLFLFNRRHMNASTT